MQCGRRFFLLAIVVLAWSASSFGAEGGSFYDEQGKHHVVPKEGFVPDETTAMKIAEAIWLPIYGEHIKDKQPFHARLVGDVWYVEGSLPEHSLGGVPEAEISKTDGRILRVSHGK